jgi:IclR family acetate operon transcriptional repressor
MTAGSVTAVDRVIDIFEAFRASRRPLSLTDLADAVSMPKSTCHAIVNTMIARGYLYTLSHPRALYPTRRMFDVTREIYASDPFIEHATPLLEDLRNATAETVILGKRQGEAVVYLQVIEGLHAIRYSAHPGDLKPLHSSSIGKALLGAMKEPALREWAQGRTLPGVTPVTITEADRLVTDVLQSRQAGFFQTRGENVDDVWAVAAFFTIGRETLAVAVAGPRHRMQDRMLDCAKQLVATCSIVARQRNREG